MAKTKEKTMTPRQLARRDAILETVRKHLDKDGFDGLSMRKIASTAGVSPSTLYEIYGSKEALIIYAMEDSIANLSIQEEKDKPGLDRFLHRLQSIGDLFQGSPETCEAVGMLVFQSSGESPAKALFLTNAMNARRTSLQEMIEAKELTKDIDVEFYTRTLVSVTWGTILLSLKGIMPLKNLRRELIRASMAVLLNIATRKSKSRIQSVLSEKA